MNRVAASRRRSATAKKLPADHPAYGLVSQRAFEDLREDDLAPRPTRASRPSGSGRVSIYPPSTRAQVDRVLGLKNQGVEDKGQLRILLWLDGFSVPDPRIEADLLQRVAAMAWYIASLGPSAADHLIMQMVHSVRPTSFVRWARRHVPDRQLLEDAFVQMSQVGLGTRPADLMMDCDAARPLHAILSGMFPGMVNDVNQLVEVFDDPDFNDFVREAASFGDWTMDDWREARDAQVNWPLHPPSELQGDEYFSFRFSLLLVSGASLRHARRQHERGKRGTHALVRNREEAS